jgi:hypothetical protein
MSTSPADSIFLLISSLMILLLYGDRFSCFLGQIRVKLKTGEEACFKMMSNYWY